MNHRGNIEFLKHHKIAFLCSRQVPASIVLKCYDWAIRQRETGRCIISGFHSQIEKDVFNYLLKGTQPIIMVLARGLKKNYELQLEEALKLRRLLIITPFEATIKRASEDTASQRNKVMVQTAEEIFVAYAHPCGKVEQLILEKLKEGKKVSTFDIHENHNLIQAGAEKLAC